MKSSGLNKSGISPAHVRKQRNRKCRLFPDIGPGECEGRERRWKHCSSATLHTDDPGVTFLCNVYSGGRPQRGPRKEPATPRRCRHATVVPISDEWCVEYLPRDWRGLERTQQ